MAFAEPASRDIGPVFASRTEPILASVSTIAVVAGQTPIHVSQPRYLQCRDGATAGAEGVHSAQHLDEGGFGAGMSRVGNSNGADVKTAPANGRLTFCRTSQSRALETGRTGYGDTDAWIPDGYDDG